MFDAYLERRRSTLVHALAEVPRGALAAVGATLIGFGLALLRLVAWRLHHPPPDTFIDLEGALLGRLGERVCGLLMVAGLVLLATDALLALLGRRARRRAPR